MNEEYDFVVCGTGLQQCIISGLMSQKQQKVLHIDRNAFYGEDGASLNLTSCWKYFNRQDSPPEKFGQNRYWNIDLVPKFIMADGQLVKILLKTQVSNYLEWKSVDATYVYQMRDAGFFSKGGGTICKVPGNDAEALKSDLMGILEKRRCQTFFMYVEKFDINNQKTWDGGNLQKLKGFDLRKTTFAEIVKYYNLQQNTIDFIGHAVALYTNDDFLSKPALETIEKIKLYMNSMIQFGISPFIYPLYGLAGIPEGFSRMCAVYGGTFMLNTDIQKVLFEDGKVCGVQSGDQQTKCKKLVMSPSYAIKCGLEDRVKHKGQIIRCICILDHPIPNTQNVPSIQIIIPQKQTGRKSDIYVMMVSSVHQVCAKNYYIAIVSTNVETKQPEKEIQLGLDLLGPVLEKFVQISDVYEPDNSKNDGLYITRSYDAQSHFETVTQDVLELHKLITGEEIDLKNLPQQQEM